MNRIGGPVRIQPGDTRTQYAPTARGQGGIGSRGRNLLRRKSYGGNGG
jgi:hypothetical protein